MGIALTSCTVPASGKSSFDLGDDEIEFGVGIHGEPGRRRGKIAPADELVGEIIDALLDELRLDRDAEVLLFVNGFGATPSMELYLVFNAAIRLLAEREIKVVRSLVGSYVTSLDMAGCSITLTALDDELTTLWDAPVHTAALRW